jgi:hypothetical protein
VPRCEKATPELQALVERGKVAASVAAKVANKFPKEKQAELVESGADAIREAAKKVSTTTHREASPKDLKKQIEDFEAEWDELNGTQKRHFVKTNQHELGELLEELEAEVEPEVEVEVEDEAVVAQQ